MALFEWLELTALADWVAGSLWGYPITLTAHGIGLAIVVGIIFMLCLRLLGRFDGLPYGAVLSYMKVAWAGFLLNFVSGFMLFSAQATVFVVSLPFLIKIAAILVAAVIAALLQEKVRLGAADWDAGADVPGDVKSLCVLSLLLWSVAIIAGRLIAYL